MTTIIPRCVLFFALCWCVVIGSGCSQLPLTPKYDLTALQNVQDSYSQDFTQQQQQLKQQLNLLAQTQQQLQLQLDMQGQLQSEQLQQLNQPQHTTPSPDVIVSKVENCSIDGKLLLGAAEWVWLKPANKILRVRIDTGAATSSLSTTNIEKFERDGKNWVRFQLVEEGQPGLTIEARLRRTVKVRQASMKKSERRYVVRLTLQLGDFMEEAEFTLADRANMRYPVLLGREFLRDVALVDVSKKYIQAKPQRLPELGFFMPRQSP